MSSETRSLDESHELGSEPTPQGPPREAPSASPGDCRGRYTIRERIGVGGMGEVFAAHDPELDRVVALKMMKRAVGGASPEARARFQREAQAMARLNHPNVVSVFDVGTVGEQVFVAMELVEGPTLAVWLLQAPRGWREVVAVFLQAGHGLEAAHAAGIVHRDFKPSNVIVGDRVRVADFGLARAASDPEVAAKSVATVLDAGVTQTGQRLGTPGYMAPELLAGAKATATSDQFAFAIALHEALYGGRPGDAALRAAPSWLRPIVGRALAGRPEDRYPSMTSMLADLARDPARARRRWAAATLALAAVASSFFLYSRSAAEPCGGAAARLAGAWDATRKDAVARAFAATHLPYAEDTWRRVAARIDAYAERWVDMAGEACRATRVDGRQSDTLMDLRMECLERRRSVLAALTELWSRGMDAEALAAAQDAAHGLAPLEECADARALTQRVPLPADPAQVARIAAAHASLDVVNALVLANRFPDARRAVATARAAADATGWLPVRARAAIAEANVVNRFSDPSSLPLLLEAARLAGAAHEDRLAAEALVSVVEDLAASQQDAARALLVADVAAVAVARLADEKVACRLLLGRGSALAVQGRLDAAWVTLGAARACATAIFGRGAWQTIGTMEKLADLSRERGDYVLARKLGEETTAATVALFGADHPRVAGTLHGLAKTLYEAGDYEAGSSSMRRVLSINERTYGADSERAVNALVNLGSYEFRRGNLDEAQASFERALEIRRRVFGAEHIKVAMTLNNLAAVRRKQGRYDEALELLQPALAINTKLYGDAHANLAYPLSSIGEVLEAKGDLAGALGYYQRTLDVRRKALGGEHPLTLRTMVEVARALALLDRCAATQSLLDSAIPRLEKTVGGEHPTVAEALTVEARCDLAAGRAEPAVARLERAIAIQEKVKADPIERGKPRALLARALWSSGRRDAAIAAARLAEQELAADAEAARPRAAVHAWLAARAR